MVFFDASWLEDTLKRIGRVLLPLGNPGQPARAAENEPAAASPAPVHRCYVQHFSDTILGKLIPGVLGNGGAGADNLGGSIAVGVSSGLVRALIEQKLYVPC